MKRNWRYLKYILRHKWYVLRACRACGVPLWQGLLHDWHKLLPSEWTPYLNTFYAGDGSSQYKESPEFAQAWRKHQHRGLHHWQHWLLTWDRGITEPLAMPEAYIREMVADWWGAGRAITGRWEAPSWYERSKSQMILDPSTRARVEELLAESSKLLGGRL